MEEEVEQVYKLSEEVVVLQLKHQEELKLSLSVVEAVPELNMEVDKQTFLQRLIVVLDLEVVKVALLLQERVELKPQEEQEEEMEYQVVI
jgi:hypothetical protein